MLTQDTLIKVLHEAQQAADVCTRFCVVGGEIDEERYKLHHNGLGSSDTSVQIIHAPAVLGLYEVGLKPKLQEWIASCHKRAPLDLNETAVAGFVLAGAGDDGRLIWSQDDEQTTYESSAD